MSKLSKKITIEKINNSTSVIAEDFVAIEEPLEIQICSERSHHSAAKSLSITMRTPGHDHDLAVGFLFTESIIKKESDIQSIESVGEVGQINGEQNTVRVTLDKSVDLEMDKLTRHFYTTSSCGVCGKSSIEALENEGCKVNTSKFSITKSELLGLPQKLRDTQISFDKTGGLHAAGIFSSDGEIMLAREDVGRHNAVDKVIGSLYRENKLPANNLGLIVSGRTSFELMQKTIVAGIPLIVAISAPSSLAINLAKEYDVTLVGFLRGESFNIYSGKQRIYR
jgi:FdhD protein